jgi:hypothetical protein
MRADMKPVWGIFWGKEYRPLKIVPIGFELDVPFDVLTNCWPNRTCKWVSVE